MIKTIKNKALKLLWEKDDDSKINPAHLIRVINILAMIDNLVDVPKDLSMHKSLRPHLLKGDLKNYWSLDVSGNYRIIFRFEENHAFDLDYIDTH